MDIVTDTNIFLAVALNEPEKDRIIRLTSGANTISPEILFYEIGNALTAMVRKNQLDKTDASSIFEMINQIQVRLITIDISAALKLAFQFNIYAYDAYFLQCAKSMSCPLISLDRKMKQVAAELKIEVLE